MSTDNRNVRKRNEGTFGAWFWSVLTVVCLIVGGLLLFGHTNKTEDLLAGGVLWFVITAFIFGMASCYILYEQYVCTLGFTIYEYEIWEKHKQCYVTKYATERITLTSKYAYHWHIGDITNDKTDDEMRIVIDNRMDSLMGWEGFETKDDAMNDIIRTIKNMITNEMTADKVILRNVRKSDMFTLADLRAYIKTDGMPHKEGSYDKFTEFINDRED